MSVGVKICGINDAVAMQTAVEAGARFVAVFATGLVALRGAAFLDTAREAVFEGFLAMILIVP